MGNGGLISGAFSSTSGKADTTMNTNGQILYYNNGRQALDKEDNDDVLTLKSGLPSWEAAGGGATITTQLDSLNSSVTSSSATLIASGLSIDLPTRSGGMAMLIANVHSSNDSSSWTRIQLTNVTDTAVLHTPDGSLGDFTSNLNAFGVTDLDGDQWDVFFSQEGSGTSTINVNTSTTPAYFISYEVS